MSDVDVGEMISVLGGTAVWQNRESYGFVFHVPEGMGRTALLFAHGARAAAGEPEYELSAGEGWRLLGSASARATNRRYVTGCWAMVEPAAGELVVVVEASRKLAGMVAFMVLVTATPGEAVAVAGPAEELRVDVPGGAIYAVTARPGSLVAGGGEWLFEAETEEGNASTAVMGALFAAWDGEVWVTAEKGGLLSLLAVPLVVVEEPEPPVGVVHEVSVIVRDIPPGGAHEVRFVRPGGIVMGERGIDWERTRYSSFILASDGEAGG